MAQRKRKIVVMDVVVYLRVWCSEAVLPAVREIEGVTFVELDETDKSYMVYVSPLYDRDDVKREIEALR